MRKKSKRFGIGLFYRNQGDILMLRGWGCDIKSGVMKKGGADDEIIY